MDALQNPQHTEAKPSNWVPIKEEAAFTPKKLRIIGVGTGFAGLTLAYKIKHALKLDGVVDFVLYEKNHNVGGVWLENKYPGVACDVPAHAYSFLFEPNPDWSHFYASGSEIRDYISRTTRKWGLDEYIQFNSRILEAIWDEGAGKWKVKIDQHGTIIEDEAEMFISATGVLNNWKWPDIQGLEDFKGKLVHTANWDDSFDWQNKRVAVLGNGSSGIQCSTAMHKKVSKMVNYVRSPTWISPNVCADLTKDWKNFAFSEEERKTFREDQDAFFGMRKTLENSVNGFYYAMLRDHLFQQMCGEFASKNMEQALQNCRDPAIAAWMKPDFRPGCRRLSPGDGYLESFSEPNTRMCFEPIDRITPTGITTKDGHHDELDLIVCASGFNTSYIPTWKVQGRGNATLSEKWKENPEAFFSVHVDDMPNYFMIAGPNFPTSNGSYHAALDFTCDYIMKWVHRMATEDIRSIEVKKDAMDDYNIWAQEYFKRTVWSDKCRSTYKGGKTVGPVTSPYPGSIRHFKQSLESIGGENFDIKYSSANRFQYLGNGQIEGEENGMGELSDYLVRSLFDSGRK